MARFTLTIDDVEDQPAGGPAQATVTVQFFPPLVEGAENTHAQALGLQILGHLHDASGQPAITALEEKLEDEAEFAAEALVAEEAELEDQRISFEQGR